VASRRAWRYGLLAVAVIAALVPLALHGYPLYLATEVVLYAIAAVALDLLVGYAGLVSLGQAAFFGLGAYAAGIVSAHAGPNLALTLAAGFAVAALYGAAIAPLSLRSAGIFFLMITLAFAQLVWATAGANALHALTGGTDGLVVPHLPLSDTAFYLVAVALLAVIIIALSRLVRSPFGRALDAVRQNETRARSLGLAAFWYKFWAFVIAAGVTGIAGVLHAHHRNFVSVADAYWDNSVIFLVMVLLGGVRSLWGGAIGAAVFVLLQAWVSSKTDKWEMFVIGAVLVAIVLFTRRGLWSVVDRAMPAATRGPEAHSHG
jgi:branched-chain amino acid transport system permease protein